MPALCCKESKEKLSLHRAQMDETDQEPDASFWNRGTKTLSSRLGPKWLRTIVLDLKEPLSKLWLNLFQPKIPDPRDWCLRTIEIWNEAFMGQLYIQFCRKFQSCPLWTKLAFRSGSNLLKHACILVTLALATFTAELSVYIPQLLRIN